MTEQSQIIFKRTDENEERLIRVAATVGSKCVIYVTLGQITDLCAIFKSDSKTYTMDYLNRLRQCLETKSDAAYSDHETFIKDILRYYVLKFVLTKEPIPLCPPVKHKHITRGSTGLDTCTLCRKKATKKCSNCGTRYCSSVCQRNDWSTHKLECKAMIDAINYVKPITDID